MPNLKLAIYLPNENIDDIEALTPLVSDIGDILVDHGFGNDPDSQTEAGLPVKSMVSYIFINEDDTDIFENPGDALLVIPVKG